MKKNIMLLLLLTCSFKVLAQKEELIDNYINELYQKNAFNGNILVAEKGQVVFEKSYGLANEKTQQKLNTQTCFELASVSKQFTAMGIVQLQKKGKLSYDDKISKYIPELSFYGDVTIKNLLTHTGGIPDYMDLLAKEWDKSKIATNDDVIKAFEKQKPAPLFSPNEKWEYSNTGYLLLATIIERISKQSYGEYLDKVIFKPLKMNNTFVYRRWFKPETKNNYASGYLFSRELNKKVTPDEFGSDFYVVYLDGIVGDGMVNSNLEDLLKWDRALYGDEIINDNDRKMIFSSYEMSGQRSTDYGFGWMLTNSPDYGKIALHSGSWGGYITYIERHLDNDKTIIVLQNNALSTTEIPVKNIRRILYNQQPEKQVKIDNSTLQQYAGKYVTETGKTKEIIYEDGKIYVPVGQEEKLELIPVSQTKFIVDGFSPEVSYEFTFDSEGKVVKYRVQQPEQGIDYEAKKIE
ncbi:beta-lactamase [Flavobacterium beibuense F44-8]|uniref:Beta-lactamase n=1 Tax=Flavobacterium beibuense F44-8 TaxID=1406840 RepID=A0A0A2LQQ1_9FLAO|nr:serine hydrolase domain-containing protein [Flavobacterium beibuense]KGO82627.1 beta-lactamase [Flavobacterium beibuense F44-8]